MKTKLELLEIFTEQRPKDYRADGVLEMTRLEVMIDIRDQLELVAGELLSIRNNIG